MDQIRLNYKLILMKMKLISIKYWMHESWIKQLKNIYKQYAKFNLNSI